ncbi:MAG TPA: magnesium transporter [Gemmatimonadales bacterium]|nr:magnesium transporter [Gemmatimonadales bacterium]
MTHPLRNTTAIVRAVTRQGVDDAVDLLEDAPNDVIVDVLQQVRPGQAPDILAAFPSRRQSAIIDAAPTAIGEQWRENLAAGEETVGWLMEQPYAVFPPTLTVAETTARVRELAARGLVTYGFVTDADERLIGLVTMRDLLLARDEQTLESVMLRQPFALRELQSPEEAMRSVLDRHYPVYPVVDDAGRLVGEIRGQALFEARAFELTAQPGSMVGVNEEERLATPWPRSLKFRHPWLQLNLVTAFLAAAVVGAFQHTLDRLVILAVFLPVLAGQSGNTGCQALAVALRGLTLNELEDGRGGRLMLKEALLGLLNGTLTGITAGAGMYVAARMQHNPHALVLSGVVLLAMVGSCVVSGIAGAGIPIALKRMGADPATASAIFLTTATDVCSMGMFLALATVFIP